MSPRTKKKNSVKISSPRNRQRTGQGKLPKSEDYIRKASEKQGLTYETTNATIAKIKGDASAFRYEDLPHEDVSGNVDISPLQPEIPHLPQPLPFLTVEDIKDEINFDQLIETLQGTENLAVLMLAHNLAKELQTKVENIVKERLWKEEQPKGEIQFRSQELKGKVYFSAKVRGSSRGIPREHFEALQQAIDNREQHLKSESCALPSEFPTLDS